METIKIEFNSNIKEKLMEFLNSFSKTEINIIEELQSVEDSAFLQHKKKLHDELKKIKSGESKTFDLEDLDAMLEKTIAEYED